MTESSQVEVWADGDHELGEGARWIDGRLVYVDILAGRLLEVADLPGPRTPREIARVGVPLGAVAPISDRPGHWIAAAGTGIALLDPDGRLDWLARPEDRSPVPTRMNDGACDPHGRFWAGSMPYDGTKGAGSLYRVDSDGSVHRVLDGLTIVNGPVFNSAGDLLYVTDTAAGVIHRCTLDPDGNPTGREEFTRVSAGGSPDGMTVDADGCLWVAIWGHGTVHRYHPDGTHLATLRLPTPQPTSVRLTPSGGRLLITTARYGLSHPAGPAGSVLCAPVDASAPPARAYRQE